VGTHQAVQRFILVWYTAFSLLNVYVTVLAPSGGNALYEYASRAAASPDAVVDVFLGALISLAAALPTVASYCCELVITKALVGCASDLARPWPLLQWLVDHWARARSQLRRLKQKAEAAAAAQQQQDGADALKPPPPSVSGDAADAWRPAADAAAADASTPPRPTSRAPPPARRFFGFDQLEVGWVLPPLAMTLHMAAIYAAISPAILPFAAAYFYLSSIVLERNARTAYRTAREGGGAWWPQAVSIVFWGIGAGHTLLVAYLVIRAAFAPAAIVAPLPLLSWRFLARARRRFEPAAFLALDAAAVRDAAVRAEGVQPPLRADYYRPSAAPQPQPLAASASAAPTAGAPPVGCRASGGESSGAGRSRSGSHARAPAPRPPSPRPPSPLQPAAGRPAVSFDDGAGARYA
jgi:hypothetical protein